MAIFQKQPHCVITNASNRQRFDELIGAYKTSGGTARVDDLALLLEERKKGDFVSVVKRIVARDIFSFEWQNHYWVPMFQFDQTDLSVRQEVHRVVYELAGVLDNWTLALWFTKPNAWLKGKRPVDMVDCQFSAVLNAARSDRFVASG